MRFQRKEDAHTHSPSLSLSASFGDLLVGGRRNATTLILHTYQVFVTDQSPSENQKKKKGGWLHNDSSPLVAARTCPREKSARHDIKKTRSLLLLVLCAGSWRASSPRAAAAVAVRQKKREREATRKRRRRFFHAFGWSTKFIHRRT